MTSQGGGVQSTTTGNTDTGNTDTGNTDTGNTDTGNTDTGVIYRPPDAEAQKSLAFANIARAIEDDNMAISSSTVVSNYVPIYEFLRCELTNMRRRRSVASSSDLKPTLFVGLSAPQGCGKTTMSKVMTAALSYESITCLYMSIDDFYLKYADQVQLAEKNPKNSLLKFRGNAGTHDLELINSTLAKLKSRGGLNCNESKEEEDEREIIIPKYDKTLNGGRGDRSETPLARLKDRVDIVIFEGWMMGFCPVPDNMLVFGDVTNHPTDDSMHSSLMEINQNLSGYRYLYDSMDAWIILHVDNLSTVYEWREAAEQASRVAGKPALSPAQIRDFVDRFFPAYLSYLPKLLDIENNGLGGKPTIKINVDSSRSAREISYYNYNS